MPKTFITTMGGPTVPKAQPRPTPRMIRPSAGVTRQKIMPSRPRKPHSTDSSDALLEPSTSYSQPSSIFPTAMAPMETDTIPAAKAAE